jgi:hypothetical protein
MDGWMDEVRRSSVTIHGLTEEYTRDRVMCGNLILGEGKPLCIGPWLDEWILFSDRINPQGDVIPEQQPDAR